MSAVTRGRVVDPGTYSTVARGQVVYPNAFSLSLEVR